jgi:predicted  nucleic acid-binding Zn-ribbon protein
MGQIAALVQANKNAQSNARSLQTKLKNFKAENEQIKKLIEQANQKIEAKEKELADSRNTIDQLNTTLNKLEGQLLEKSGELETAYESLKAEKKNLETTNTQLSQTVKDLEGKTNFISDCARAYVVCGTKKALRQNDILKKLNMNLTSEYKENVKKINQTINFYEKDQINCDEGNIIKILPERPADSYSIDGGTVKIIDFKKFWATDKVVVLVKED